MTRTKMQALVQAFRASTAGTRRFRADVSGERASLYLYDVIGASGWGGGIDPKDVVAALANCNGKPLDIFLNSPGGDVFDGMAIHSALSRYGNQKTMHVDGLAASAASVVLMAGDKICCAPGAQIMIHDPWAMAMGNSGELRQTADLLDQTGKTLVDVYAKRTGQSAEDIAAWMAAETWMTAQDAVERGFADEITGKEPDGDENGQDTDADGDGKPAPKADSAVSRSRAQALVAEMKARLTSSRVSPQQHPGRPGK